MKMLMPIRPSGRRPSQGSLRPQQAVDAYDASADPLQDIESFLEVRSVGELATLVRRLVLTAAGGRLPRHGSAVRQLLALLVPLGAQLLHALRSGRTSRSRRAGWIVGLEVEGLSAEDQVYQIASRFIDLVRQSVVGMDGTAPNAWQARQSFVRAARTLAPGWGLSSRVFSLNGSNKL